MTDLNRLASRILDSLRTRGYHHEPAFSSEDDGGVALVALGRALGSLFVAGDMDPDLPVIVTDPAADAPSWRPFDRPERIGWHNDFSTREDRPILSLAWIARGDPEGGGDWRAASSERVLARLASAQLDERVFPLGYSDSEAAELFPLVASIPEDPSRKGLRFYGRALREGAILEYGKVPAETERLIAAVEEAADAVGETLPAQTGALLVCHNWLSLHDRTGQTTGPGTSLRKSILCFVRSLHGTV
jgi:hypothetical protein